MTPSRESSPASASRDVVLVGIGHTNAHVLRTWRTARPRGMRLTCVSAHPVATYSGRLPGVLAGQYSPRDMEIDLGRLCADAGVRLVIGEATGVNRHDRTVLCRDHPPVPFDVLSIGVGSVPTYGHVTITDATRLVPVKPMQTFLSRLDQRLQQAVTYRRPSPVRIVIVGGGAAGVELALCVSPFVRTRLVRGQMMEPTLIDAGERLLPGSLAGTARRVGATLSRRGVLVVAGRRVEQVNGGLLVLGDRTTVEADLILWVTGAVAPAWLASLGLPTDDRGFLLTDESLRTIAGDPIFAVGDSGTVEGSAAAKAGVFAVRQGPILWRNIQRVLAGAPLDRYTLQRGFLKLLNTGDGRAIGEWKGLSFEGAWCARLKHAIDGRFMRLYR